MIDARRSVGPMPMFWRGTGFTPAHLLLGEPMQQLCEYLGSIPFGGVEHARIHFLLELVRGSGFASARPDYDWSLLDRRLDVLVGNRLKPFFELMGNPGGFFDNFEKDEQVRAWRRLVRDLARHCMARYGRAEVRSWYFETWNEPDVGWWKQSDKAFHNYYDACSAGLMDADPKLRMGGPGTCVHMSDRLKSFLKHCDSGRDFFTGRKGVRLDFISVHEKGSAAHREDLVPNMPDVCRREAALVAYLRKNHPRLAGLPLMNNECDPQVGWGDIHTWHGKPYYAALIARAIWEHQRHLVDELRCNYALLSNDNGFLGTWGQRTHLAMFGTGDELSVGRFEQIKKPCHNVMTMLALLGQKRLAVENLPGAFDPVGVMASRSADGQVAVLVYNSVDDPARSGSARIELELRNLPFESCSMVHYRIDAEHGNPYAIWERGIAHGHTLRRLTSRLLADMRKEQELTALEGPRVMNVAGGRFQCAFDLPLPGVSLLLLSPRPKAAPPRVGDVSARRYAGLMDQGQVMLRWTPLTCRALRTYEVLHRATRKGPFRRVNEPDLLCGAFLHVADHVRGYYKVRAVDPWGRAGGESPTIEVT